jgi:hypothetical protein
VGQQRTQAKLITHEVTVISAVETLSPKTAQQINIIGKCKFLVESQILIWTNKICFMEELPLGSLGLKKLSTSESSFTKFSRILTFEVCGFKPASGRQSQLVHF